MGTLFDEMLAQHQVPTSVDNLVLPLKGGGSGGQPASSGTQVPVSVNGASAPRPGTAPEPAPQLPEGSDPEEPATEDPGPAESEPEPDVEPEPAPQLAFPEDSTRETSAESSREPVFPVIDKTKAGLSFEGETAHLKQFPKVLIELLRSLLAPSLGASFAAGLSQNSTVTAFVIASLGIDFETDRNTALAVEAFRAVDSRIRKIEEHTKDLLSQQTKVEAVLKKVFDRLGEVADTTTILEMGQAYALAERTAVLKTDGVLPETIDVTQKRAVAARDNIRARTKALSREEKHRAGRPIR
ncbi:hypothetical protein ANMWB30_23690 [Arthrobacter sp. MWB30]|nr:hypothetical protein ANMWB30_23690 [Arthrobacter sp. MWB30]